MVMRLATWAASSPRRTGYWPRTKRPEALRPGEVRGHSRAGAACLLVS